MKKYKILLTGGGSAGHVWPIVAIAQALKKKSDVRFIYVGASHGFESKIAVYEKLTFAPILVGKWRNYFSLSNLWDIFKTAIGLLQSLFLILSFKPDVVFAKGGYVAFPILFWTKICHISLVIHESDVIPGRANLWASHFAKKVCLGFPEKYYHEFPTDKTLYTGIPLVESFFEDAPKKEKYLLSLLITGGSQGSHKLNETMLDVLPELLPHFEVYHLVGGKDFDQIKNTDLAKNENYHVEKFTYNMQELMKRSDLIISRAGANTLAEIAALSLPAILVPYAYATGDHQSANAQIFAQNAAALIINEKDLTRDNILNTINQMMADAEKRRKMGSRAHEFYNADSTQLIIDLLLKEHTK